MTQRILGTSVQSRAVSLWLDSGSDPVWGENRVTVSYGNGTLHSRAGKAVASFTDRPVENLSPRLERAVANGNQLTLTYHRALDEDHWSGVTVGNGREVSVTAVRVEGKRVVLTLAESVSNHKFLWITYGEGALRGADGHRVGPQFWRQVTVETPNTAPVFNRAAALPEKLHPETRTQAYPPRLLIWFSEPLDFSQDEKTPGSAFTLTATRDGVTRTIRGTDTALVPGADVWVPLESALQDGETVTVSYTKPAEHALRDRRGLELESFSGQPVTNRATRPRVETMEIVSDPGDDDTYGRGDPIRIRVAFNIPVRVWGSPRVYFYTTPGHYGGERYADYEGGSGTSALTFAYRVAAEDRSTGIRVGWPEAMNSPVQLNGGRIATTFEDPSHEAVLTHGGLPTDTGHRIDGSMAGLPYFDSAEVAANGTTLTVTFTQSLDSGSAPAPGAFHVTVNGSRRNVAAGGVAIDGATVRLTLASAVIFSDTVTVRYDRPSANPLRNTAGEVNTFPDRAVINNAIEPLEWTATLTVKAVFYGQALGCNDDDTAKCSTGLTSSSFDYGGATYQLTRIAFLSSSSLFVVALDRDWPQDLRENATLHVGATQLSLSDASFSVGTVASWSNVPSLPGLSLNAKVSLRLTTSSAPSASSNAVGASVSASVSTSASVTGVSLVSDPGADDTYGLDDTVKVRVTFSEPVDVTGTPRLKIKMDPAYGEKWAAYQGGGGTSSLTFTHTVAEPNLSTAGLAVLENTLELDGGAIRTAGGGGDAALAHDGLAHDTGHQVDWRVASDTEEGGMGLSQVVSVPAFDDGDSATLSIDENHADGAAVGTVSATDIDGDALTYALSGDDAASFDIGAGGAISVRSGTTLDYESKAVYAFTARVTDGEDANGEPETTPVIDDTIAVTVQVGDVAETPVATGVALASSPANGDTYASGETIEVRVTFSEAVDVDTAGGTPRLTIKMDPGYGEKWAAYAGGSGGTALTFAFTVVEPNHSPNGIAVLANTLQLNGGDIESASSDTDADLSHTGLGHDANHKVDWQQSQPAPSTPAVTGVTITSDPGDDDTYASGETIEVRVTFSEAVDVDTAGGTPRLTIKMDPGYGEKWAAYASGSGGTELTFAFTVVEPNHSPNGIAVLANTLQLNGGDIESASSDTDADLAHTGLGHDAGHMVDWRLSDGGGPGT